MGDDNCCQYTKIWGSKDPKIDGFYTLVSKWMPNLPYMCQSSCVYEKKGSDGQKFCFAPSMITQGQCIAVDGEEVFGYGSGMKPDVSGSGMKPGGYGSGMKPEGYGNGMKPEGNGNGMKPDGSESEMKPDGNGGGMKPEGSVSGKNPNARKIWK